MDTTTINQLRPNHIRLYMGLFNVWERRGLSAEIILDSDSLRRLSDSAYMTCLEDLERYGLISYESISESVIIQLNIPD